MWPRIADKAEFDKLFLTCEQDRLKGNFLGAMEGYKQLLTFRLRKLEAEMEDFTAQDAIITERLVDLSSLFGYFEVANHLLKGLTNLACEIGNEYVYLYMAAKWATLLANQDRLEESFAVLGRLTPYTGDLNAISFSELPAWEISCKFPVVTAEQKEVLFIRLYYAYANVLLRLGQYSDAHFALDRAITIIRSSSSGFNRPTLLPFQLMKGRCLLEKGSIGPAQQLLKRIKDRENLPLNHLIPLLEIQAKIHLLTGQFGRAMPLLEEIRKICQDQALPRSEIQALLNQAGVMIFLNQVAESELILDTAAAKIKDHHGPLQRQIQNLRYLAKARSRSTVPGVHIGSSIFGNIQIPSPKTEHEPLPNVDTLLEVTPTGYYLPFYEEREMLFKSLLARDLEQAAVYLEDMREFFQTSDSKLIQNRLIILRHFLKYYQDKGPIPPIESREVLNYLDTAGLFPERWEYQRLLSWQDQLENGEKEALEKSNEQILKQMSDSLPAADRVIFSLNKWMDEEVGLARQIDQLLIEWVKWSKRFFLVRWFTRNRWLKKLQGLTMEIGRYKQATLWNKTIEKEGSNVHTRQLLPNSSVPKDRLEIGFLVLPDRLLIHYRGKKLNGFSVLPISRIALREAVKQFHQSLHHHKGARGLTARAAAHDKPDVQILEQAEQIAALLRLPDILGGLPDRIKRLTIIPDDVLNGLPFALLPFGKRFLIERFAVTISHNHPVRNNKDQLSPKHTLTGYAYRGSPHFLPGVPKELAELETLLGKNEVAINSILDPQPELLFEKLKAPHKLIHLACHGVFDLQHPGRSGLILPGNRRLSLRQILEEELFAQTRHITLSSCWGADNFTLPGRWIISLPETICRSGADSVLACLWEVNDQLALPFMKRFYQALQSLPRDLALREAQLYYLRDQNNRGNAPYFWAGYQLHGRFDRLYK